MYWDPHYEPNLPQREKFFEMASALEGSINHYQHALKASNGPKKVTGCSGPSIAGDHYRRYALGGRTLNT
jgi:hypothetical protein